MRKYDITVYTASQDYVRAGHPYKEGARTEFVVSNKTLDEIKSYPKGTDQAVWAAAIFPINAMFDAEVQEANAKLFCNYMNKVAELQEKARLGAEMGFLNY
jgi:hypothetical protein